MNWLQSFIDYDKELFLYLNSFYSDFWDTFMLLVTRKETWIPFYVVILWYFVKNYRSKSVIIILFLALTILASDQVALLIKNLVMRLRPVYDPAIQHLVHNVLRKGSEYGFVSSHAANYFAILTFTSRIFKNRRYWLLLFFWVALICYSRIYSGVHYPGDILGGAVVGRIIGWLFYKVLMFVENHFFISRMPRVDKTFLSNHEFQIISLVFIVLVSTILIAVLLLHRYNYL